MSNEGKRINSTKEQSEESGRNKPGLDESTSKLKRPLDWDARDLKENAWIRDSPESTKGRYEDRYFQDE